MITYHIYFISIEKVLVLVLIMNLNFIKVIFQLFNQEIL